MIDRLHPIVLAKSQQLVRLAKAEGIAIKLTEGYRPPERQAELLATGATVAKPGYSFHQYGLAFDLVPLDLQGRVWWEAPDWMWQAAGRIGESLGLTWGGRFTPTKTLPQGDRPHFEYHPGFTIQDLVTGAKQVGQLLLERPAIPLAAISLAALLGVFLLLRRQ